MTRELTQARAAEEPTCPQCGRYCLPWARCPACGHTPALGYCPTAYDDLTPHGEMRDTGLFLGLRLRRLLDVLRGHRG
jgi:hypothetical protein